jgi:transcription elongation GreA/GreB family factor
MTWNARLQDLITSLEQERDELRLKVHLASRDARDEFAALEARLDSLRDRLSDASEDARETASEVGDVVGDTARKLADDLRDGYRRIRDQLQG